MNLAAQIVTLVVALVVPPQDAASGSRAADGTLPDDRTIVEGELAKKLDTYLAGLEKKGFSGTALVASHGAIVLRKGYGLSNRVEGFACAPDTVYDIGSITKQFTAAAILVLEGSGKLAVGDLLSKHLEGVPEDKKAITLHQLLTHSAGMPNALGDDYEPLGREEFLQRALASKLQHAPGAGYRYSNVGYSILAALVERISGVSYEEFLAEHLFAPAGMQQTGYRLPEFGTRELAVGYRGREPWGTPLDHAWADDGPWWNLRGNGGILSTATDMYRWHVALTGDKVLPAEARAKLVTPYVPEDAAGTAHYAYGWLITKTPKGTRVITHNGGNGIFFADFYRLPEDELVLFIATNHAATAPDDVGPQLVRLALGTG